MKQIENAPIFKRIVAAVMDGLFAIFMFFILLTYVATPIGNKATDYEKCVSEIYQQQIASHLFMLLQQNDNGDYKIIEVKDYTEKLDASYFQKIHDIFDLAQVTNDDYIRYLNYYYTVYLTGDISKVELPSGQQFDPIKDNFVSPVYDVEIEGKKPIEIYTSRYFNTTIMGLSPEGEVNESEYYDYPIKDNVTDYEGLPVIKEGVDADKVNKDLCTRVYKATKEFAETDYMASRLKEIKRIQLWEIIPTYIFVVSMIYIVVPLLFKNGETLGKVSMNIGIVSSNGYKAKKTQILLRSLVFVTEISLSLFIIGYSLASFATLGVGCFIMMACVVFTKKQQAPHDLLAMTIEVDTKKSVYFENAKQENRYEKQVQDNIESLNKYEPENPNIIQVGSTIVDDRFKPKKEKNTKTEKDEK